MRLVRGLGAALLWIAASLLGLVAVLLCVTIILLPVGIPLLRLAGKLYGSATRLMLPRAVAHPVEQAKKKLGKKAGAVPRKGSNVTDKGAELTKKGAEAAGVKKRRTLFA